MYEDEIALPVWRKHPSIGEPVYETIPVQEDEDEHDCSDADRPCDDCLTSNLPVFDGE